MQMAQRKQLSFWPLLVDMESPECVLVAVVDNLQLSWENVDCVANVEITEVDIIHSITLQEEALVFRIVLAETFSHCNHVMFYEEHSQNYAI